VPLTTTPLITLKYEAAPPLPFVVSGAPGYALTSFGHFLAHVKVRARNTPLKGRNMVFRCLHGQAPRTSPITSLRPPKLHLDIGYVPPTDTGSLCLAVDSTHTGFSGRWPDGLELTARWTQSPACDVDSFKQFCKKKSCSALTSVTSALKVIFNVMRSINSRFTYLLTYLLTYFPKKLIWVIELCMNIPTYYTRRPNALHYPVVKTILRKRSVIFTAPLIWNQLNPDFHILPSVASFKFNYKKFLISVY